MKKIVMLFGMLSLGLILAGKPLAAMMCHASGQQAEVSKNEKAKTKAQAQDVTYTTAYSCPMHPEVQSDKPGKCPECGMNLEKVKVPTAYLNVNKEGAKGKVETKEAQAPVIYTCPMHPEVQSDKPGKCPKCGMNLVEKDAAVPCPKHSYSGGDECPKCGIEQQKKSTKIKGEKTGSKNEENKKAEALYTCPMHPEVQSDKPGKCPKCGMNLEKK